MKTKTLIIALAIAISSLGIASQAFAENGNRNLGFWDSLKIKAEILGMTSDELSTLRESKTILQIAEEKGISKEEFRGKMIGAKNIQLDQMLEDGTITKERYDYMKQRMQERQEEGYGPKGVGRNHDEDCPMNR